MQLFVYHSVKIKHEYLRSRASKCLSLSSFPSVMVSQLNFELYRDTRAFILDLASRNFYVRISSQILREINFSLFWRLNNCPFEAFDFTTYNENQSKVNYSYPNIMIYLYDKVCWTNSSLVEFSLISKYLGFDILSETFKIQYNTLKIN